MSTNAHCLFALTALLALTANACSASTVRVARANEAPAQCPGGIIRNDADVAHFSGCTGVVGDLQIASSRLSDLEGLESIRSVSGALVIADNNELSDLSGLEQLSSVGSLHIQNNPELSNVAALSTLHTAPVVELRSNPALTSVRGLEGLTEVEKLTLVDNGMFETAGLSNLHQVGELTIANNSRLISLHGLNGLTRARSVEIRNNRLLCAQLGFLPQLGEVSEALVVSANRSVPQREVAGLFDRVKGAFHQPGLATRELALH
jgi:Receptor L domain